MFFLYIYVENQIVIFVFCLKLNRQKRIEYTKTSNNLNTMLKTILNFSGVKMLSKEEQINIIGKGDSYQVPRCDRYAPPGSNPIDYPNYPCADPQPDCRITIDGTVICG